VITAREIMTSKVVSVAPDTPTREIAWLLRDKGISAVPVVDGDGAPMGMVSEGDLIGRDEHDREARRDWWLALLAEGETLGSDFLAQLQKSQSKARDVMSSPVVTATEDTGADEIARLLAAYRIKRVPVVRDRRVVGIVSRADLLRALAAARFGPPPAEAARHAPAVFAWIDRSFHRHRQNSPDLQSAATFDTVGLRVGDFRGLVADFERGETRHREDQRRAAAEQRQQQVSSLIDQHVGDESWRTMLQHARRAAERGQTEFMLLRFPSQLCSDGGRAINMSEPDWPTTLSGEAAELYLRWERELRAKGFRLSARVLDYPGGMPGDVGLFLLWGE
jgi:CBS domain-containing protein